MGGIAALYRAAGHTVKMVSMTNGDAGHQTMHGNELACRRRAEATAAGAVIGATYEVLDNHDGELLPTLETRRQVICLIRSFHPDLVLTHRPNDYHPDHRYTATLVQDAAYMVTVPYFCPDIPHLTKNPVFLFAEDEFQRPNPFTPDLVVAIDDVVEKKLAAVEALDRVERVQAQSFRPTGGSGRYVRAAQAEPDGDELRACRYRHQPKAS